jgi:hypothetical protein
MRKTPTFFGVFFRNYFSFFDLGGLPEPPRPKGNKGFKPEKFALKRQKAAFPESVPEKRTFVWGNYNAVFGRKTRKNRRIFTAASAGKSPKRPKPSGNKAFPINAFSVSLRSLR